MLSEDWFWWKICICIRVVNNVKRRCVYYVLAEISYIQNMQSFDYITGLSNLESSVIYCFVIKIGVIQKLCKINKIAYIWCPNYNICFKDYITLKQLYMYLSIFALNILWEHSLFVLKDFHLLSGTLRPVEISMVLKFVRTLQ